MTTTTSTRAARAAEARRSRKATAGRRPVLVPGPSRPKRVRRQPGSQGPPLVDVLAPAYLVLYVLLTFDVFFLLTPLPQNTQTVLVLVGLGTLLLTPRERLGRLPIVWSAMAFIGWNIASLAWSELPGVTTDLITIQLIPLVVASLVVGTIPPRVAVKTLVTLAVLVAVWTLIVSLVLPAARSAIISAGPDGNQPGFRGTFGHKNDMGIFAVYSLCLILPFFRSEARRWAIALCVVLVLTTRSATAASGLMAVGFAWFWIAAIDGQKSSRERQFLGVVSVTSAFAGVLLAVGAMPALLGLYQKDLTFSGRTFIWAESIVTVARQPIQGFGYGGVWWDGRSPVTKDLQQRIGFGAAHAHNGAIEVLLTVGVVGLILFLFLLYRAIRLSTWSFGQRSISTYGQWGLLTVPALVLMSISEPLFRVPSLGLLVLMTVILTKVRNEHLAEDQGTKRYRTTF